MEASTTIEGMIRGNRIFVPDYQRAYSWEVEKQVSVFLSDLEDYQRSNVATPYYFGHFLYEKKQDNEYAIIDGQQRLTTITIFLCALFNRIKEEREITEDEEIAYENMIKRKSRYKFSTVQYDDQLFRDYVIDNVKKDLYGIDTTSGNRIVAAYDFFVRQLKPMNIEHLNSLLSSVTNASCTTHIVNGEAEAIQMFIFQNNRGKKPSRLEVVKAQFMYNIHIYGLEDTDVLIQEVKSRFEHIYRSISDIEDFVDEDAVLSQTLKVYFNTLWGVKYEKIDEEIAKDSRLDFIKNFTLALDRSFNYLSRLNSDRKENIDIEGSLLCGHYDIILPFFIKAYTNGVELDEIGKMAKALGDLMLRDMIIKTRAELISRMNDVFVNFGTSVNDIIGRIQWMKTIEGDYWWGHWSNVELKNVLNSPLYSGYHNSAKIILWKYENYLKENEGKAGYAPIHYNSISSAHLEHIAPQTENGEKIAAGYDEYDEDFTNNYLLSIGNFLLLSSTHNESIGNKPFEIKRNSYNQLRQQREIQEMTENDHIWDRKKIQTRKEKIVSFILNNL